MWKYCKKIKEIDETKIKSKTLGLRFKNKEFKLWNPYSPHVNRRKYTTWAKWKDSSWFDRSPRTIPKNQKN